MGYEIANVLCVRCAQCRHSSPYGNLSSLSAAFTMVLWAALTMDPDLDNNVIDSTTKKMMMMSVVVPAQGLMTAATVLD
jgi:hypothetical protein